MTHSTKSQTRPSLSVRTRASIHKTHAQFISCHGLPWKRIQMRLRDRITSDTKHTSRIKLSESGTTNLLSSGCYHSLSQDGTTLTQHSQKRTNEQQFLTQHDLSSNYLPSCSSSSSTASISSDSTSGSACKWEGCGILIEPSQLITHIQQVHVFPQFLYSRRKCFTCLWRGCRVFRQPSVSAAWLEQHILHHTDAKGKPFRCIFDSCTLRFSTSMLLERHVQRCHIRTRTLSQPCTGPPLVASASTTPLDESCVGTFVPSCVTGLAGNQPLTEMCKISTLHPSRNVKKCLKRRRKLRCYRVRRVDFYDNRSQCVIQHRLKILGLLDKLAPKSIYHYRHDDVDDQKRLENFVRQPCRTVIPHLTLPKPLYKTPPNNKLRLRSAVSNDQESVRPELVAPQKTTNPTDPSDLIKRLRNVALLLTMPHTIIGQRLSGDRHTEFLIRWLGDSKMMHLPPTWISEEHFKAAQTFSDL